VGVSAGNKAGYIAARQEQSRMESERVINAENVRILN
jgi:hypothetical protein